MRLITVIWAPLLLLLTLGCEKVEWKAPPTKPAPRTEVEEGHQFSPQEIMAGPYLLVNDRDQGFVRYEVQGDGCAGGKVAVAGETVEAKPSAHRKADGRLQGTVCEAPLPPLPRCSPFEYKLLPFEKDPRQARLPPGAGAKCPSSIRILVLGDTRTGHDIHRQVVTGAMVEEASFIVNLGDIVQLNQRVHDWYQFFEIEKDLLPQAPFVLVPGNHETWWDGEFGALMLNRFFRAGETGGTGHHSKDVGPVHMVFLDVYWGEDLINEGLEWLENDLKALPTEQLAVVFLHEPPISFGAHRPRQPMKQLMPIFQELGVAAVVAGHSHVYEHFLVDEIHYVTAGGGGAGLHELNINVFEDQEQYLVKNSSEHHYLLLTVTKETLVFTVKQLSGETLEEWAVPLPTP